MLLASVINIQTVHILLLFFFIPRPSEKDNTSFSRQTCQNIFLSETIAGEVWPYAIYKNIVILLSAYIADP